MSILPANGDFGKKDIIAWNGLVKRLCQYRLLRRLVIKDFIGEDYCLCEFTDRFS